MRGLLGDLKGGRVVWFQLDVSCSQFILRFEFTTCKYISKFIKQQFCYRTCFRVPGSYNITYNMFQSLLVFLQEHHGFTKASATMLAVSNSLTTRSVPLMNLPLGRAKKGRSKVKLDGGKKNNLSGSSLVLLETFNLCSK